MRVLTWGFAGRADPCEQLYWTRFVSRIRHGLQFVVPFEAISLRGNGECHFSIVGFVDYRAARRAHDSRPEVTIIDGQEGAARIIVKMLSFPHCGKCSLILERLQDHVANDRGVEQRFPFALGAQDACDHLFALSEAAVFHDVRIFVAFRVRKHFGVCFRQKRWHHMIAQERGLLFGEKCARKRVFGEEAKEPLVVE